MRRIYKKKQMDDALQKHPELQRLHPKAAAMVINRIKDQPKSAIDLINNRSQPSTQFKFDNSSQLFSNTSNFGNSSGNSNHSGQFTVQNSQFNVQNGPLATQSGQPTVQSISQSAKSELEQRILNLKLKK